MLKQDLLKYALIEIAQTPAIRINPDGVDQAAYEMQIIASSALDQLNIPYQEKEVEVDNETIQIALQMIKQTGCHNQLITNVAKQAKTDKAEAARAVHAALAIALVNLPPATDE